jgi:hypothetical protein
MDYSDIFSIIGDLNEVKGGEVIHYRYNIPEANMEDFLDRFTDNESRDDNFIDLVTEEEPVDAGIEEAEIVEVETEPELEPAIVEVENKDEVLGDWMEVNIEDNAREDREVREAAYQAKLDLKKELKEEQETFDEEPKSVYKDINDLITRYKDIL